MLCCEGYLRCIVALRCDKVNMEEEHIQRRSSSRLSTSSGGSRKSMDPIPGAINHARTSLAISIIRTLCRRFNLKAQIFCSQISGVQEIIEDAKGQQELGVAVLNKGKPIKSTELKWTLLDISRCQWVSSRCDSDIRRFCALIQPDNPGGGSLEPKTDPSVEAASKGFQQGLIEVNANQVSKTADQELRHMQKTFVTWWDAWKSLYDEQGNSSFMEERLDCFSMAKKMQEEIHAFRNNWVYFARLFGGEVFNDDGIFKDESGRAFGDSIAHATGSENKDSDDEFTAVQDTGVREILKREKDIEGELKKIEEDLKKLEAEIHDDEATLQAEKREIERIEAELHVLQEKKKSSVHNVEELKKSLDRKNRRMNALLEQDDELKDSQARIEEEEWEAAGQAAQTMVERDVTNLSKGKGTDWSRGEDSKVRSALNLDHLDGDYSSSDASYEEYRDAELKKYGLRQDKIRGTVQRSREKVRAKGHEGYEAGAKEAGRMHEGSLDDITQKISRLNLDGMNHRVASAAAESGLHSGMLSAEQLFELGVEGLDKLNYRDLKVDTARTTVETMGSVTESNSDEKKREVIRKYDSYYRLYTLLKRKLSSAGLSKIWLEHVKKIHATIIKFSSPAPNNPNKTITQSLLSVYMNYLKEPSSVTKYAAWITTSRNDDVLQFVQLSLENNLVKLLLETLHKKRMINDNEYQTFWSWLDKAKKEQDRLETIVQKIPPPQNSQPSSPRTPRTGLSSTHSSPQNSARQQRPKYESPAAKRNLLGQYAAFNTYPYPYLSSPFPAQQDCSCMRCGRRIFRP